MTSMNPEWLEDYAPSVFARIDGYLLDAYAIALEGWRRGLELKWYSKDAPAFKEMKTWYVDKPGKLYSLSDGDHTRYFFRTRSDKVSNQAVAIAADKDRTKEYLAKHQLPFPKGARFEPDCSDDEIIRYAKELNFPLVIKPTDGSFGRGITVNITDINDFRQSLIRTRHKEGYQDIIVEEHIKGDDYRLYVVGDQVVGAIRRTPAYVIGDGQSTIEELIQKKNQVRRTNPRLANCLIKIDDELIAFIKKDQRSLSTVPEKDDYIFLNAKSNISIGGDAEDKLDCLTDKVKAIAVKAVKAVPGLYHCGVDLLLDQETDQAVVIELNPTAQIGSILFPGQGKARDVPAAIIDYYFPKSKVAQEFKSSLYLPLDDILQPLFNQATQAVTVKPAPLGELYQEHYYLRGKVNTFKYQRRLKNEAVQLQMINGYIKKKGYREAELLIATNDQEALTRFNHFITNLNKKTKIKKVDQMNPDEPIQLGFHTEKESNLKQAYQKMKRKYFILDKLLTLSDKLYIALRSSFMVKLYRRRK